jgi:RimJ/RimL family protein N-acetyltransferase
MAHPHWPLFDIVVTTPRLELRYPDDDVLMELADVTTSGVHPPDLMPFIHPWTRVESPELERNALKFWWTQRAEWTPQRWAFLGAVIVDGHPVGIQSVGATDFEVTRTVGTGSWLGLSHHGRGLGKEMRAAILHFAFEGLGAVLATSGAFEDNAASLGVSRHLGYEGNGDHFHNREGHRVREVRLKLPRSVWESQRRDDITITGLDGCLDWFGVASSLSR